MIVGAFLAEAASVVDNKLNVSGGVLYRFAVDPDRSAQFLLVVLTQAETDDPDRRVDVEVWRAPHRVRATRGRRRRRGRIRHLPDRGKPARRRPLGAGGNRRRRNDLAAADRDGVRRRPLPTELPALLIEWEQDAEAEWRSGREQTPCLSGELWDLLAQRI